MSNTPVIDLREVTKTYFVGDRPLPILKGITLQIKQGEFLSLMGPSGSGKSTLLHVMGGLDHPTSGSVSIGGYDVSNTPDPTLAAIRNRLIGFVFQSFYLLPYYTALENVCLPLYYSGTYGEGREAGIKLLEKVGLGDRIHHRPNEMSGGERQRVAIARALINHPKIIFADEPTGNLDTENGEVVMSFLKAIHQSGTTVVLITHNPDLAQQTQRLIHLQDGLVV